jgi:hypothetical protein
MQKCSCQFWNQADGKDAEKDRAEAAEREDGDVKGRNQVRR